MATSLVDDTRPEHFLEPPALSGRPPQLARAEWLWTLFGAGLLLTFLSYVVLTSA